MFISKKEKIHIQNVIESLRFGLADATTEILYLKAKVKVLEGKPEPVKKKTPTQLKAQREYMRKYTARKRAEKLAQAQA